MPFDITSIEIREATLEEKARWQALEILRKAARETQLKVLLNAYHYVDNRKAYERRARIWPAFPERTNP
jgi:hypothetical protein